MTLTARIPGLRIITRALEYINRPAPLEEFPTYDAYWESRAGEGRIGSVLDRHRVIAGLVDDGDSVLDIGCGDGSFLRLELGPSSIFVTIPNVGCLKHRLRLMLGGRFPITTIIYHMKEHLRFWTVKDFRQWAHSLGLEVYSVHGQFSRGDRFVEWAVRKYPGIFAPQVIYELRRRG